jgi:small subunit ribosomal protein S18
VVRQESPRPRPSRGSRPRYAPVRKVCAFCAAKTNIVDYKDAVKLRSYISDRGRIASRRRTGTCARHQRVLAVAIKRARHLALLPFAPAHLRGGGIA